MVEAIPKGIFSRDFHLWRDGRPVAELDVSSWSEKADVDIEGVRYQLYRRGMMSGAFVLGRDGEVVAEAHKPSALSATFEIQAGGRTLTLRKESFWSSDFGLFEGERRLGGITKAGVFTRRARVELPAEWPSPIQTFIFWLALLIWNREASSS